MSTYILTDSSGLVVATATVPDADLALQPVPDGLTQHIGFVARPFHDRLVDGQIVPVEVTVTPKETKAKLLARLAERRWQVETGGVTIIGGLKVETDDRSKLLIVNAADRAREDPTYAVRWKVGPGTFINLDAPTLIAVEAEVFAYVQRCFAREAELSDLIDAAEDLTPLASAVEAFWP